MKEIFILLGSNRGDRQATIEQAKTLISSICGNILRSSHLYETEPWGFEDTTAFLNQVIEIESALEPEKLMERLLSIETQLGRERVCSLQSAVCSNPPSPIPNPASSNSQFSIINYQFSSRPIDLDILFYGHKMIFTENLMIPHPRLHLRRFTLEPLNELSPTFQHPVLKKTISVLLQECNDAHKVGKLS